MAKKIILICCLGVFIAMFSFQTAIAYDRDWQAKQKKLFEQTKLKPGEVIDNSNWQKVIDLLPPSVLNWVKKGEFNLKIGEFKYDFSPDETWDKASSLNRDKYGLGKSLEIIDKATGKSPTFVSGKPYPDINKNDPNAGIKIMHNSLSAPGRYISSNEPADIQWVGEKGYEREISFVWYRNFYWQRLDGAQPNPSRFQFQEIIYLTAPYDIAGTASLQDHYWDARDIRFVMYVPSIRRIKKLSAANRSDPFFGTDFVNDDGNGWCGKNESMKWRLLEEKVILMPTAAWNAEQPDKCVKQADGSWKTLPGIATLKWGFEDKTQKGAPWQPLFVVWIPRIVYVIEAIPLDPYYNYGKQIMYVDKETHITFGKVIHDKAGAYWKTMLVEIAGNQWDDDNKMDFGNTVFYLAIDDKTHHASACNARGKRAGAPEYFKLMKSPENNPKMYTNTAIAQMSK